MKLKPLVISHETVKQPPAAYPQFNINTTNIANATMPTAVHPPALHVAPPVIRETLLSDTNIQTQVPTYNINNVIYPHNTIVPGPICDAPYELDTPALETNI